MNPKFRFLVVLREHERGWGQKDFHADGFETLVEAEKSCYEVNSQNTAPNAPDYYIQARIITDPREFHLYESYMNSEPNSDNLKLMPEPKAFALPAPDPLEPVPVEYKVGEFIVRLRNPQDNLWSVSDGYSVLNVLGEWEYEPLNSNRTEEFLQTTRYSFDEAVRRAQEIQKK